MILFENTYLKWIYRGFLCQFILMLLNLPAAVSADQTNKDLSLCSWKMLSPQQYYNTFKKIENSADKFEILWETVDFSSLLKNDEYISLYLVLAMSESDAAVRLAAINILELSLREEKTRLEDHKKKKGLERFVSFLSQEKRNLLRDTMAHIYLSDEDRFVRQGALDVLELCKHVPAI